MFNIEIMADLIQYHQVDRIADLGALKSNNSQDRKLCHLHHLMDHHQGLHKEDYKHFRNQIGQKDPMSLLS